MMPKGRQIILGSHQKPLHYGIIGYFLATVSEIGPETNIQKCFSHTALPYSILASTGKELDRQVRSYHGGSQKSDFGVV